MTFKHPLDPLEFLVPPDKAPELMVPGLPYYSRRAWRDLTFPILISKLINHASR